MHNKAVEECRITRLCATIMGVNLCFIAQIGILLLAVYVLGQPI